MASSLEQSCCLACCMTPWHFPEAMASGYPFRHEFPKLSQSCFIDFHLSSCIPACRMVLYLSQSPNALQKFTSRKHGKTTLWRLQLVLLVQAKLEMERGMIGTAMFGHKGQVDADQFKRQLEQARDKSNGKSDGASQQGQDCSPS